MRYVVYMTDLHEEREKSDPNGLHAERDVCFLTFYPFSATNNQFSSSSATANQNVRQDGLLIIFKRCLK